MRVLVCGSRTYSNTARVQALLSKLPPGTSVVHGACRGADSLVHELAKELGLPVEPFPADWDKYGDAAGAIRNQKMLESGPFGEIHAFVDKPLRESTGTYDMVKRCLYAGKTVVLHEDTHPAVEIPAVDTLFS